MATGLTLAGEIFPSYEFSAPEASRLPSRARAMASALPLTRDILPSHDLSAPQASRLALSPNLPASRFGFKRFRAMATTLSLTGEAPNSYEFSAPQDSTVAFTPNLSFVALRNNHGVSRIRNSALHAPTITSPGVDQAASASKTKYYFLVANAKFMLDEEEHFQELLKERLRNFGERNRKQDFWVVIEPKFLENFPGLTKRLSRPAVALVSTDYLWITFMKLRLDRVLRGEVEADSLSEVLKSSPVNVEFETPQVWTAPYTKYASGWWTPFLPPQEG